MVLEVINNFVDSGGLIALFLLMLLNGFASTPPSEITLFLGGLLAYASEYTLLHTLAATILGNLTGAYLLFLLGRKFGYKWVLKIKFIARRTNEKKLKRIARKFHNEGAYWVGVFRCLPFGRSIISLPAGMIKMPHFTFLFYSFIGISVWAIFWQAVGYFVGITFLEYRLYTSLFMLFLVCIVILVFKQEVHYFHNKT